MQVRDSEVTKLNTAFLTTIGSSDDDAADDYLEHLFWNYFTIFLYGTVDICQTPNPQRNHPTVIPCLAPLVCERNRRLLLHMSTESLTQWRAFATKFTKTIYLSIIDVFNLCYTYFASAAKHATCWSHARVATTGTTYHRKLWMWLICDRNLQMVNQCRDFEVVVSGDARRHYWFKVKSEKMRIV